ncbi:complement factor H-like [Garra rufa]|uniref:complement factor H-like n=1 Tax=Garra rufa TaxID=137080 RepID=UPI003CCEF0A1
MGVPVKLLGLGFCLLSLHCVRCQNCPGENIKYENTEPLEKASYSDGETLSVNCMTGYTGLYKLKCEKGEWKATIEHHCAKKKCSHPGDTPNGDFKLTDGTEFVFGATVVYTCKKGYEMASRINQRTCRTQGWDNAVPVCEVVKCPAIRTDGDVTASGNTEEGNYGDVIHFECVSSEKMIVGSSDIHCKETGKWSDDVPKCKEITCKAPLIENGEVVNEMPEYRKGATLEYKCNEKFKKREGIPKCSKFGWTIKPEYDVVKCPAIRTDGDVTASGNTEEGNYGDVIHFECVSSEKIIVGSSDIHCKETGKWSDDVPKCKEITCKAPLIENGEVVNEMPEYRKGATLEYKCNEKFKKREGIPKCSKFGWTIKPECDVVKCPAAVCTDGDVTASGNTEEGNFCLRSN